ncbi:MAG: tyrosine--tRNA ligase [Fimbriiglobus sp.]
MFRPVDEQLEILMRGAAQLETPDDLRKKLQKSYDTGKPLRIKYGIDPTGFDVHLGHTVPLRKLRQFQELGHKAVLIIGTATAQVGDPSGRDESRSGLTPEQIQVNAQNYLTQIAKVIDVTQAEVVQNSAWFHKFDFAQMLRLLGSMTMQRMLERDDFDKRLKAGTPIYLHECLYPLMQGHDSVEIRADVELGGTEQLFNLMVGRNLQRQGGQEAQIAFTMPILRGLDGEKKMGKSLGNYIGVAETPKEMFGKTMRIPDDLMCEWFTLLTSLTTWDIAEILGGKPNEAKKRLGAEIVRGYHGEEAAQQVLEDWRKQFEVGGDPDVIPDVTIAFTELTEGHIAAAKLAVLAGFVKSNSEGRKKIEEGAFNYGPDRTKPAAFNTPIPITPGMILRLGRKIVRVKI